MRSFKMVKSIPRSHHEGHGRRMVAYAVEENYGYWYGEDDDGSSFNYVQDKEGNMQGSIVDMAKDAVMQFVIEDGIPVVIITKSSDFGPEVHPNEYEHGYVEDQKDGGHQHHNHDHHERMLHTKPQQSHENAKLSNEGKESQNDHVVIAPNSLMSIVPQNMRSRSLYDDSGGNIDIVVVWTRDAECRHFGLPTDCTPNRLTYIGMQNLVKLAVEETNTAYDLSGVDTKLLVVHGYRHPTLDEKTYSQFGNILTDLKNGKIPGVFESRERYGGDLVSLIINDPNYCGVGYVGPSKAWMYSVVSWNCATGYFSFAHEVGHNLGLEHDRGSARACDDLADYNYGYRDPQARFRSILAYGCVKGQCDNNPAGGFCTRVQRFSNPNTGFNGEPIGTRTENNARKINEVKALVAGYYPHKEPTPQPTPLPRTNSPTTSPTKVAVQSVTRSPTTSPTDAPTDPPTFKPTRTPSKSPTKTPTIAPTHSPSMLPTHSPTMPPTHSPTMLPTHSPTMLPTDPVGNPTKSPSKTPTKASTNRPTNISTEAPVPGIGSNVARNKPTWQSSTESGGVSSKAVDGNTDGNFLNGSVTHTGHSTSPSWTVHLMSKYMIHMIKIYNRRDCCGSRLSGFKIILWNDSKEAWTYTNSDSKPGAIFSVSLPSLEGNRVQIIIPGEQKVLSLAEVEVFGTPSVLDVFTLSPTATPTVSPTYAPTATPTAAPTIPPTKVPTMLPTNNYVVATAPPTKVPEAVILNEHDIGGNIARGKPTWQSSIRAGGVSSKAVDGNTDGDYRNGSVTQTLHSTNPTWSVNFLAEFNVKFIKIYNRNDCCGERLRGFKIVLWKDTTEVWTYNQRGPKPGDLTKVNVPSIKANRLEISIPGEFRVLSLAEVEVFGTAILDGTNAPTNLPPMLPTASPTSRSMEPVNLSRGKPTSQTSTRFGGVAAKAVDGNTDGDFENGSVTHTLHSTNPNWSVDLLSRYTINHVKIYNRSDCCGERLRGFKVTLWDGSREAWTYIQSGPRPGDLSLVSIPSVEANKLEISLPGDFRVLSLAEVEVFGLPLLDIVDNESDTTDEPTVPPTQSPTKDPTRLPTTSPTGLPTKLVTSEPTRYPTQIPTEGKTLRRPGSITKAPTEAPTLSERENIAYNKPTYQTSTAHGGIASRAVDGNKSGDYDEGSVTHTHSQIDPSWTVDLITNYNIETIKVYNRVDCCMNRLAGFKIIIWNEYEQVWTYTHSNKPPSAVTVVDVPNVTGDRIEIMVPGKTKVLSLAEVVVFSSTEGSSAPTEAPIPNVALFKPTTQSSTAHDGISSKAVDGNRNGYWFNDSVTHTAHYPNPSWSVDLLAYYVIKEIKIYNRKDCCQNRIAGFHLYIWKDNERVWSYVHQGSFAHAVFDIHVPSITGDKIEVMIPGESKVLSLAEVEVYGIFSDISVS